MNEIHTSFRMLDSLTDALGSDYARRLVSLEPDAAVADRLDYLSNRCTEGTLTTEERAEYQSCIRILDFLAMLRARAEKYLHRTDH